MRRRKASALNKNNHLTTIAATIMSPMLTLGSVQLDAPFFQAGLAGYSDTAMRLVARRHGAPYAVTEALLDVFLLQGGRGLKAAELDASDHPIAGQLMGSHAADISRAAKVLVSMGYDVIDVNLACPVKKIRKRARGGHLLSEPHEAAAILDAVRQAVPASVPCTVKLRRGTDLSVQAEHNFRFILESAITLGYAGAVVHGRTVEQKYLGQADWNWLAQLVREYAPKQPLKTPSPQPSPEGRGGGHGSINHHGYQSLTNPCQRFVVGGSGDIWCAADIFRMIETTGVHWVSVARGCIGNPWIFHQARALMSGDVIVANQPPTIAQQREVLREHFQLACRVHGEKSASFEMRKFGIKFSRHHPDHQQVAKAFIAVKGLNDWLAVLDALYATDGPGRVADMSVATPLSCEAG